MGKRLLSCIDQMRKIHRFSFIAIRFQMTIMIYYTANDTFVKVDKGYERKPVIADWLVVEHTGFEPVTSTMRM